jgi:hypothetical protein
MATLPWAALPFSLTQTGSIDHNEFTVTGDGTLNLYVEEKARKGFYFVAFRVPGATLELPDRKREKWGLSTGLRTCSSHRVTGLESQGPGGEFFNRPADGRDRGHPAMLDFGLEVASGHHRHVLFRKLKN